MQLLASETARQAILLPALFLLMAVGTALLACGPAAQPTPSPGGNSQTATETYAAIRIWTCADPYDSSTQAVLDWLSDQGISGRHVGIVTGENFLVVDRVAVSLLDTLSQRDDVFGVDHIQESPPPLDYQDGDELWPLPPPLPARKHPKLDRPLDSLVIASTKCLGADWPAAADPQVWVKILLMDNPDTATTRAIVSWLKANGVPIQDSDLYRTWVEGYRDGTTILIYSFPVSLVLPLSEQPGVIGISKYVPETPSVGPVHPAN